MIILTQYILPLKTQDYIFGEADYDLCMLHVKATMDKTVEDGSNESSMASLGTLRYLVFSCTYGGRMEDEFDIRTLETFLNRQVYTTSLFVLHYFEMLYGSELYGNHRDLSIKFTTFNIKLSEIKTLI